MASYPRMGSRKHLRAAIATTTMAAATIRMAAIAVSADCVVWLCDGTGSLYWGSSLPYPLTSSHSLLMAALCALQLNHAIYKKEPPRID